VVVARTIGAHHLILFLMMNGRNLHCQQVEIDQSKAKQAER
jgi:hypothetical protein